MRLLQQRLTGRVASQGQGAPTGGGVPQGAPRSPLSRPRALTWLDQVGHKRGSPETVGATRHRDAAEALLVWRPSAAPALQAFEARATRRALTITRAKTRRTQLTEGCDVLGCPLVKRRRPTRGQGALYLLPSKAAPRRGRRRRQACTTRRAPLAPPAFVQPGQQGVRGGATTIAPPTPARPFGPGTDAFLDACDAPGPVAGKAAGSAGSNGRSVPCLPEASSPWAVG